MHVQLNTDHVIHGSLSLSQDVEQTVASALQRFDEQITRVEVHLNDVNGSEKTGPNDIRCMIEARVTGHEPVAVSDHAPTVDQALRSSVAKLQRALDSVVGRRNEHRREKPAVDPLS
ncbi:HPF/RaiA family ribosome-associated protein [Caldimonas brevitalea]|uniref:Ribosomal subunit interface protein n=1 Tax=Caldimonas brevitalea TaxID=413882 RepID=A0A0G3BLR9_9BURK|nr:HPF/RaiA family ribosome-associated protein [Caldimonas brevitalea]AKJ27505.1 ribosomal subunit interface protein [Caldimonas brevitalea]